MEREGNLKQWVRLILFVVVMGVTIFIHNKDAYALDYGIEHSLNATLYTNSNYAEGGGGVPLTASGATVRNWDFTESRYLQINIMVVAKEDEVHVVEIKLPSIFYAINDITEVPNGYSKVEFTKNNDILTNNGTIEYKVNKRSGTVRYYLKPNMTKASIQMEIRYDNVLWDKFGSSLLTKSGVDPIKVSIGHENEIMTNVFEKNASSQKISKAYSKTSLQSTGAIWYKRNWNERLDYWDSSAVFQGPKEDKVRMLIYSNGQGNLYLDKYYEQIIVEVTVPSMYYMGKTWYLEYDKDTFLFNGAKEIVNGEISTNGNTPGSLVSSSKSSIKIRYDNIYGRDGRGMTVDFNWPSGLTYYGSQAVFKNGKVKVSVVANSGELRHVFTQNMGEIRYEIDKYESVYTYEKGHSINNTNAKYPEGAITKLGGVNTCNSGTADSVSKKLVYSFHAYQLVEAINLPTEVNVKEYTVSYTLKDDSGSTVYLDNAGNRVYNSSAGKSKWSIKIKNEGYGLPQVDNIFTLFKIKDLPEKHQKYYFGEISYTLGTIRRRCHLNSVGEEMNSAYSAGVFFGKVSSRARTGSTLSGYFRMISPSGSGIGEYTIAMKSKVVNTESAPYGVDSAAFSKDTIKAGESVYTSGKLMVVDWFYGADCTWIHNIRVGIELPEGVSINKSDIDIRTPKDNKKVDIVNFRTKKKGNKTLYIIELSKDLYVGYYSRDMKELDTGGYLKYNIKLRTDRNMNATSLFTDEMMFLAPVNQVNAVAQNRIMYQIADEWDLNGNGSTSDMIGRAPLKQSASCAIAPNPASLDVSDSIEIVGDGSSNGTEATTYGKNDIIQYKLNITSNNDGKASSFIYYIPIPKKTSIVDNNTVTSSRDESFDMQVVSQVTTVGNDLYQIEYCTEENYTYDSLRELSNSNWYTYEELNTKGIELSKVTAIRVVLKSGSIEKGMSTDIIVNMKYQGTKYYKELGKYNEWKSCGYYDYDDGVKKISGHYPTSGVKVILDGEEEINEIYTGDDPTHMGPGTTGGEGGRAPDDDSASVKTYYMFEIAGYTQTARSGDIPIRIEREDDSIPVKFVLSNVENYTNIEQYINPSYVEIKDDAGNRVNAIGGIYILKANTDYTMVVKGRIFGASRERSKKVYIHSLDDSNTATRGMIIELISAFKEH